MTMVQWQSHILIERRHSICVDMEGHFYPCLDFSLIQMPIIKTSYSNYIFGAAAVDDKTHHPYYLLLDFGSWGRIHVH